MPKKQLFGDDDGEAVTGDAAEELAFSVNTTYADKFEQVKRKQELQRLSSKYADVDMDDDDTDEDDDAVLLNDRNEAEFAHLLKRLRANDPKLRDKSERFFKSDDSDADGDDDDDRPSRPFRLKDEFQRAVVSGAAEDDADQPRKGRKARTDEERAARAAFLSAAAGADDTVAAYDVKEAPALATGKQKKSGKKSAEADISEAFDSAENDDDKFLSSFFGKAGWKLESEPTYTWEQEAADDQDEAFYDDAEQWEREFQEKKYRHEEGEEATRIQAFPRQQEGLLRTKDTARKEARDRKVERKREEEHKASEELKRLKNLKKEEIRAFQRKIAEVAGVRRSSAKSKKKGKKGDAEEAAAKAAFMAEDEAEEARIAQLLSAAALEEEYDPEKFDQQMAQLFNDDYYQAVDDDEKEIMAAEDEFATDDDDDEDSPFFLGNAADAEGDAAGDADAGAAEAAKPSKRERVKEAKSKRTKVNEELPEALKGFDEELLYPTKALTEAVATGDDAAAEPEQDPADLQRELDEKVDEYWKLHYSGTAGGVRTRYKYREVNAEHFGLSDEEILSMDDRALNMIAPLACYATYNSRAQNTKDRYKALHRRKVLRVLPSERRSRRYNANTVVFDPEQIDEATGKQIAKTVRKRVVGDDAGVDDELKVADDEQKRSESAMAEKAAERKAKQRERFETRAPGKAKQHQQQQGHQQHQQRGQGGRPRGGPAKRDASPGQRGPGGGAPQARRGPRSEQDRQGGKHAQH